MIPAGSLRQALGRDQWAAPTQLTDTSWVLRRIDNEATVLLQSVSIDQGAGEGVVEWIAVTVAHPARWPDPGEMALLRQTVWKPTDWVYEALPPEAEVSPFTRTLWGRADGKPVLPRRVRRT